MRSIPSVLVIDDNFASLKALTSLMTALGAEKVCEAESAEDALQLVGKERFDLIVSDYRLEGMNGVEFLEKVRAQGNQTPILLLSGAPDKAGVIRATIGLRLPLARAGEAHTALESRATSGAIVLAP